jgi:FAD:protein FMN transferase
VEWVKFTCLKFTCLKFTCLKLRYANLLVLLSALMLSGCGEKLHKQQAYVFGTLVEITVYEKDAAKAKRVTNQVLKDFDAMHQSLHAWQTGDLETINSRLAMAQPGTSVLVKLPPELIPILQDASRLSALTEGLFNPSIGNLVRLWGFHSDTFEAHLPDAEAIKRLVAANPQMSNLHIDGDQLSADNPALRLDLGGYAKGYALDQAAATMKREGVNHALINIGGNILALGKKGGQAWKVGIQHPRQAGALAMLELHDGEAIGTSGDYQRYFEFDGKRYCHLIDPRTGWPADQAQAVTVIARGAHAGTLSDVASKPLFIAGPSDWRRLADKMGIVEALFITVDGQVDTLPAMQHRLIWPTREGAILNEENRSGTSAP